MVVTIRQARPDDADAIVDVLNPIIAAGTYTAFTQPFSPAAERSFIAGLPARALFHLAVSAVGRVVGFQTLAPFSTDSPAFDHVGVMGTFVDLAWHRQGIARQLFAATFTAAPARGFRKVFTYVRADNAAGLAAYRSQGFRVVGVARRQARIAGRDVDEVIIEKWLG
jgi:L-amino acid N-acyltransferase YncA